MQAAAGPGVGGNGSSVRSPGVGVQPRSRGPRTVTEQQLSELRTRARRPHFPAGGLGHGQQLLCVCLPISKTGMITTRAPGRIQWGDECKPMAVVTGLG